MKTMELKISLFILLFVIFVIHSIDGKRFSFGSSSRVSSKSHSRGRSKSSNHGSHSSSHTSSNSHTGSSTSSHSNNHGTSVSGSSSSSNKHTDQGSQGNHGLNSNGQGSSLGSNANNQNLGSQTLPTNRHTETNKYQGSSNGHGTSSGTTSHQTNKDASTKFLESESGGASRPSQGKAGPDFSRNTNPSAPPYNQDHVPNAQVHPNSGLNLPGSMQPSAPPYEPMHAPNFGGFNTNAPPKPGPYLPGNTQPSVPPHNSMPNSGVFNPHGMNAGGLPGNFNPNINNNNNINNHNSPIGLEGFQKSNTNPIQKQGTAHPSHTNTGHRNYGGHNSSMTNSNPASIRFENFQKNHNPYPPEFGKTNMPNTHLPPTGFPNSFPPMNHPSTQSMNPSSGHPPFGNPSFGYPSFGNPSFGNPHSIYPPMGGPYGATGHYPATGHAQMPVMGHAIAQPAMQPYVPGQTVIMLPNQQDSGRGMGQLIKEALVFSTVNAGVHALIHPHTHHSSDVRPPSTGDTTTTHITYNNYNVPPGSVGSVPNTNLAQGNVPPANFGTPTNVNIPQGNVPVGNPTNYPSGDSFPSVPAGTFNSPVIDNNGSGNTNTGDETSFKKINSSNPNPVSNQDSTVNNQLVNNESKYRISDQELWDITEKLFTKDDFNLSQYIILNLQNRSTSVNVTDEAKQPLLYVQQHLNDYPSVLSIRALFDNYVHKAGEKEDRTNEERKEENLLLELFLNTNVMINAMQWLANNGFIDPDDFERRDVLRHIWFTQYGGTTSGFERVFMSERYGDYIIGIQDWIYFNYLESQKRIDYMGYVDKLHFGNKASLLKINYQMEDIVKPNATIFVGTSPELEMALYTICFYARPNNLCPISLGGAKFYILTHSFRYYGQDVIDLGIPTF